MIYGLKLLLPVLALWVLSLFVLRSLFRGILDGKDFKTTFNVVLLFTVVAFLSIKSGLFLVCAAAAVLIAQAWFGGDVKAKVATFWMAAILFPPLSSNLGGVGGIGYVFTIDHFGIASLMLLLPAAFSVISSKERSGKPPYFLDVLVCAYPVFRIILQVPSVAMTSTVRSGLEVVLDLILPYYVMTRGLRDLNALRFVLRRVLVACMFAAAIAFLEAAARKNIYSDLQWVYGVSWSLTHTLMRNGMNRVQAMTSQPIVFATQILFTLGLWVAMAQRARRFASIVGTLLLLGALVLTWSRGPWIGALVFGACMLVLPRTKPWVFGGILVVLVMAGAIAKSAGMDESVMAALKDVFGSSQDDAGSIQYRSQLLDSAIALIHQSPWTGVPNYAAQMQDLKQGEGIIDVVNTYVSVALSTGMVGLVLFLAPFLLVLFRMLKDLSINQAEEHAERRRLLQAFTALMVACLVTIFTTSIFERLPFLLLFLIVVPTIRMSIAPSTVEIDIDVDPTRQRRTPGNRFGLNTDEHANALPQS